MDSQRKQEITKSNRKRNRSVKILLVGEAKDLYQQLKKKVNEEEKKGVEKSRQQTLFRSVKQKIEFLRKDPEIGKHIEQKKIPKEYVLSYEITNLWKINLSGGWRMIYTLRGNNVEILAIVVDIFTHKEYDKKFSYKKR